MKVEIAIAQSDAAKRPPTTINTRPKAPALVSPAHPIELARITIPKQARAVGIDASVAQNSAKAELRRLDRGAPFRVSGELMRVEAHFLSAVGPP